MMLRDKVIWGFGDSTNMIKLQPKLQTHVYKYNEILTYLVVLVVYVVAM